MKNILVVDDDKEIVDLISIYLQNDGFHIVQAFNGQEALDMVSYKQVDLIVLDIMMPELDGMEVCRKIREKHMVPIIMLSAKSEDMDKIMGLMTGADDYMIKPFNPLELTARVKSLLRRSYQYKIHTDTAEANRIHLDGLEIDKVTHDVSHKGTPVSLTSKEFDILYLFSSHPGRVFGAEEIFKLIWKEQYFASNNTVMTHISNLRDKLENVMGYKLIKTVWGVGYKIEK